MPHSSLSAQSGIEIRAARGKDFEAILSPQALAFIAGLERQFGARRIELLNLRKQRQSELDAGWRPDFLEQTAELRTSAWKISPVPKDLQKRQVEITGPVDRKMVVNALNSGADTFMADFEDSNSPTWENNIHGQINLRDAIRRQIDFTLPATGKSYALGDETATLLVRPRGWHLEEQHMTVDGSPISASLFDFGLFFFHNAAELLQRGSGPYFYLPKLESHLEARLWNDVFLAAQEQLGLPAGTIKATVLIETIMASFEMHEILYELREHSAGLNCGRWDYIFSFIKRFRKDAGCMLPDRSLVGMDAHFLSSYSQLLIQTCHRRGAHAMGGMAAQIPIKNDAEANRAALEKVRKDKQREARAGHDGTWVAHPALVAIAREQFELVLGDKPNQLDVAREDVHVQAEDLLRVPSGPITEAGLRQNLNVGIQYVEAWLRGVGCVPIHHLMEDAATAEISRTQIWQWLQHSAKLDNGTAIDRDLVLRYLREELSKIEAEQGSERFAGGRFQEAAALFEQLMTSEELEEFLTLPAYQAILSISGSTPSDSTN